MDLSKKVAVITGGGSGIGRAVAAALARRDVAGVALVDMSEAVEGVAEKLNAEAGRTFAIPFQGNATDDKFRASVFDAISSKYGQVSLCVPAAGITRDDLAVRVDKADGQGPHLPGRAVQAGHRREPHRTGVLGARDDRAHRRGPRRQGPEALDAR